jgi:hypothetical protein
MPSEEGVSQQERNFQRTFFSMLEMVKLLYEDYLEWKRPVQGEYSNQDKIEEGEDPPKPPPSPPSSPSSSSSSTCSSSTSTATSARKYSHSHKHKPDMTLFKLDVKYKLPMYNGEFNAEKLDNWVRQMEVYCNK